MWTRIRGFFAVLVGVLAIALVLSSNDFVKVEFKYGWFGWVVSVGCIAWGLYAMAVGDSRRKPAPPAAPGATPSAPLAGAGPAVAGSQPLPAPVAGPSPARLALYVGIAVVAAAVVIGGLLLLYGMRSSESQTVASSAAGAPRVAPVEFATAATAPAAAMPDLPPAPPAMVMADAEQLERQNREELVRAVLQGPVLDVPIGDSPIEGAADARVTITVFTDFQCSYSARLSRMLAGMLADHPGQVRIVHKNLPLQFHSDARLAAEAALAAAAQGKYTEYAAALYAAQADLMPERLEQVARDIGLDLEKFRRALDRHTFARQVDEDVELARALGNDYETPQAFVDGRRLGAGMTDQLGDVVRVRLASPESAVEPATAVERPGAGSASRPRRARRGRPATGDPLANPYE